MNCIIVDDEPLALNLLRKYSLKYGVFNKIDTCSNAVEAFQLLSAQKIDLMFLDIRMPGISGIDFLKSLKNPPLTVFTSAYNQYAVDGFELEVADYLLKPITYERFERCMQKILRTENIETKSEPTHTYFKVSRELIKIEHKDLIYIQSIKDYILIKTIKGNYISYMTMKNLEEILPKNTFFRIHRSYIVNQNFVTQIKKNRVILTNTEFPLSDTYKNAFIEKFVNKF